MERILEIMLVFTMSIIILSSTKKVRLSIPVKVTRNTSPCLRGMSSLSTYKPILGAIQPAWTHHHNSSLIIDFGLYNTFHIYTVKYFDYHSTIALSFTGLKLLS